MKFKLCERIYPVDRENEAGKGEYIKVPLEKMIGIPEKGDKIMYHGKEVKCVKKDRHFVWLQIRK